METVRFENRYEITRKFTRDEIKLSQKRSGKINLWFVLIVKIWSFLMVALFWIGGFVFDSPNLIRTAVIFSIAVVYLWGQVLFRGVTKFRQFSRILEAPKPIRTVSFGECIEIQTGNSTIKYPYEKVRFIEENDECFYFLIWANSKMFMPVYKNSFTVGSADEFLEFLKEKCAEKEPLWSKRQMNKRMAKDLLLPFVAFFVLLGVMPVWLFARSLPPSINPETAFQDISAHYLYEEVELITSAKIQGGAVAFGKNETDNIYTLQLKKILNRYVFENYYQLPLSGVSNRNMRNHNSIYEIELLFDSGAAVLSGVAYAGWWDEGVPAAVKAEYEVILFDDGGVSYVLYFRVV